MWIFCSLAVLGALPVVLSPLVGMRTLPRELDALAADAAADAGTTPAGEKAGPTA